MLQRLDSSRGVRQVNVVLELFGWLEMLMTFSDVILIGSVWGQMSSYRKLQVSQTGRETSGINVLMHHPGK